MKTVLIVDDEQKTRTLLQDVLALRGYGTCSSGNLKGAEEIMQQRQVDVVLCDVMLPDGNGFEFRKRLVDPPPFLFFSCNDDAFISYCADGESSFLMKPLNIKVLLSMVDDLAGKVPN